MQAKSEHLQIRVTPRQKAALKRHARAAGVDVSTFVLARALPPEQDHFAELLRALRDDHDSRFALAGLHDFLVACPTSAFTTAVERITFDSHSLTELPQWLQNYVAALVEQAADRRGLRPPAWIRDVAPLESPYFAGGLQSLRPYLIAVSPVTFKRRNLFVDSGLGARV
jgi:uncharacterized protein (DUF1778 family)